jgi:hypothetical protein
MISVLIALMLQAAPLEKPLPDPALEARAQSLMRELRCTVCENEPVSQSTADMAVDARRVIRPARDGASSSGRFRSRLQPAVWPFWAGGWCAGGRQPLSPSPMTAVAMPPECGCLG